MVGETLEGVGFSATKEKSIRQTRLEQSQVMCCFHFFYIKKVSLKSRTWKLNEHYLKINEDRENYSEV